MKMLEVTMPDGSKWRVEASIIARHRARCYADETTSEQRSRVFQGAYDHAMQDNDVLIDWAANNMNWKDVSEQAQRHAEPASPDYQEGWVNGQKRIVNV